MAMEAKKAGRPRSDESRMAVLRAASEILSESGLAAFSIDAVASRAGVARTTIYRWWPSKGLLAIESFLETAQAQIAFQHASSAASAFGALLESTAKLMSGANGRFVASILLEAQKDRETLDAFNRSYHQILRRQSIELLESGMRSGEFHADLNPDVVLDAAIGAIYFRMLLGQEMDEHWVKALAASLLDGMSGKAVNANAAGQK